MKTTIITWLWILTVWALGFGQSSDDTEMSRAMEKRIQELSIQLKQRADDGDLSDISETLFQLNINADLLDSIMKSFPAVAGTDVNVDSIFLGEPGIPLRQLLGRRKISEREGIVKFGGNAVVGRNELIRGDVVVFGGDAVVYGSVKGGIIVVKGNVKLASTGYVRDDIITIWGNMKIDQGAQISGKTTVFDFGKVYRDTMGSGFLSTAMLIFRLVRMLIFFVIAFAVMKAFPEQVTVISKTIEGNYLKSLIVGLIGLILIPVLFIILLATILGIPIAVLLLPLLVIGGFILGGTSAGLLVGRRVSNLIGLHTESNTAFLALGILLIELPSLLGRASQPFSSFISTLFFILTLSIFLAVWIPGLGGVIITRFGKNKQQPTE